MELRHLRYFIAVAESLNFTKASARLRVAQPALSRQVQALEDELGVDLLKRSPRGVMLTAEGKLFLAEARDLIGRAAGSVDRVRALARGEYGELHVGYAPSPTAEILPPALAAFQKQAPGVKLVLHDLAGDELVEGLLGGTLDLSLMLRPTEAPAAGVEFELLRSYPLCAAIPARHPFAKLKTVPVSKLSSEPLVVFRQRDYADYHRLLARLFEDVKFKPRIAAECDGGSSLFTEIQAGRGIAILPTVFRHAIGTRLELRPLAPGAPHFDVGIAHAANSDQTPAGEKFRACLRRLTKRSK